MTRFDRTLATLPALGLLLSLTGCDGGLDRAVQPDSDEPKTLEEAIHATAEELEQMDWSEESWYSTFGDEEVLLAESDVELDRYFPAEDRGAQAIFASDGGQPTLRVIAGQERELVDLSPEEYTDLWERLIDTGLVAFAMEGRPADFHQGKDSMKEGVGFSGSAGPRGLGWTIMGGTRQGFESQPEPRRAVELLAEEASEHSELYRQAIP